MPIGRGYSSTAVSLMGAILVSCGHPPLPPAQPFAASDTFHDQSGSIYAILEADLDGDAWPDALVAQRSPEGWSLATYLREREPAGDTWRLGCRGPSVPGSELERFGWIPFSGGELLLLLANEEDPDELGQSFVVLDPRDGCRALWEERIRAWRPHSLAAAPKGFWVGTRVDGVGHALVIVDRVKIIRLENTEQPVALVVEARQRRLRWRDRRFGVEERRVSTLRRRPLTVSFRGAGQPPMDLPEVVDDRKQTSFVVRSGAAGELTLTGSGPFSALRIHHGCGSPPVATGGAGGAWLLRSADGSPYVLGTAPTPGGWVRAVGRTRKKENGTQLDLVLLAHPMTDLMVQVPATEAERCLCEIDAFGFAWPPFPETTESPAPAPLDEDDWENL